MKKSVAILQSNYIPWKGYFDIINMVDEFILYDDVQYTKNDWRNRNKIKMPKGPEWLTIPVNSKGRLTEAKNINEITVSDPNWNTKHWDKIVNTYKNAKFFRENQSPFQALYNSLSDTHLSSINYKIIKFICNILDIGSRISWSTDYEISTDRNMRLVELCQQVNANKYLSGPAAKCYLDEKLFNDHNIEVVWMDYSGYPEYTQSHPPFEHGVSILDLIFNEGANATKFMKSF